MQQLIAAPVVALVTMDQMGSCLSPRNGDGQKLIEREFEAEAGRTGRTGSLAGGPVVPPSRWAATSNVEVSQTTYAVNRGKVGIKRRKGSEGQSHKEEERR